MKRNISHHLAIILLATHSVVGATFTVTNTNDDGPGSLRQALLDSNQILEHEPNLIQFSIPGPPPHTISPASGLPKIKTPVIIDGATQPGFAGRPVIELEGSGTLKASGLYIVCGNSTVRGLVINRFGDPTRSYPTAQIYLETRGGNRIEGNFLGPDLTGTQDVGTPAAGIRMYDSSSNIIGGTNAASRNVISGNATDGIDITASTASYNPTTGTFTLSYNSIKNQVLGNFVGVDVTGTNALGNGQGISIWASANIIGGTNPTVRNIISGNKHHGVDIVDGRGNVVQGNFIGTDVSGTTAMGNGLEGVFIQGLVAQSMLNTIGGSDSGAGNLISGNGHDGIQLWGDRALRNIFLGNLIGTDVSGRVALGNGGNGISMLDSFQNSIGGAKSGEGNTIAFNGADGVFVQGASNAIRGNRIFSHPGFAINSTNVLQNLAVLKSAASAAGNTVVQGSLTSKANALMTLDFFYNSACDLSGQGEGQNYLGTTTITADANGAANFNAAFAATIPPGTFVTTTVTDAENSTSEFSRCIQVSPGIPAPTLALGRFVSGNTLTLTWATSANGFVLETTDSLSLPISWGPVAAVTTVVGDQTQVTVNLLEGAGKFYRLRKP